MKRAAIGFRAHTGWAAAVTIAGPAATPSVVDRRRINLLERGMPWEVYHVASRQSFDKAEALIERAQESARGMARAALEETLRELRAAGHDVVAAGVVMGGRLATLPLEQALRAHAAKHAAEGQLYRDALLFACDELGLRALGIPERELEEHGAGALGLPLHDVRQRLVDLGRGIGPPWAQDQRHTALIAWLALTLRRKTDNA